MRGNARHPNWKGDAIGKQFHLDNAGGPLVQVVGIARMAKYLWIAEPPNDFVYLPYRQHPYRPRAAEMSIVAESVAPDASTLASALRDVVRKLDPEYPASCACRKRAYRALRAE